MLVDLVQANTCDDIRLDGAFYAPGHSTQRVLDIDAFLLIHGTGGNFYSSTLFDAIGEMWFDSAQAYENYLGSAEGAAALGEQWRVSDVTIREVPSIPGTITQNKMTYDIDPHAGGTDFDDSKWPLIEPKDLNARRSGGHVAFMWYRALLTIPTKISGLDPSWWRPLRVPRTQRLADKDSLARRDRHVALRQTAGARPVHLAVAGRRNDRDHPVAVGLYARRHRLEEPNPNLAAKSSRLRV